MAKEGLTGLHSVVQYKTFFDYIRQDLTSSYSTFLVVGTRESRHSCFSLPIVWGESALSLPTILS